jgi:hypothetical protein
LATKIVSIDIGGGNSVAFPIKEDVVEYFNIKLLDTAALNPKLITRSGYTFTRKKLTGEDSTSVTVQTARYYKVPSSGKRIAGQKIIIPTKLTTSKGNIRMVTLRIPQSAVILAIASWVWSDFQDTAKRPEYFRTERGVRVPVRNYAVADVNPGSEAPTEPAPAP